MNKITTKEKPEFTPGWLAALEALVNINAPVLIALGASEAIVPTPATSSENSWKDVIVRLLKVQRKRGYKNGWIIYQILEAGNPPMKYWVWLGKRFGYNSTWPTKIRGERPETAFPDIDAIDFEQWEEERHSKPLNMFDRMGKS
jgi:hypothetical protein